MLLYLIVMWRLSVGRLRGIVQVYGCLGHCELSLRVDTVPDILRSVGF